MTTYNLITVLHIEYFHSPETKSIKIVINFKYLYSLLFSKIIKNV